MSNGAASCLRLALWNRQFPYDLEHALSDSKFENLKYEDRGRALQASMDLPAVINQYS